MEKKDLMQKALQWFEKEYQQTPAQHGYPFISTRKRIRLIRRLNEVIFATDEQTAKDYIYARRFIERSSLVFYGIAFFLGGVAGIWLYLFSHRLAFCFYILALIVALALIALLAVCYVCYKVVSPLEEKYQNKIAVYVDV